MSITLSFKPTSALSEAAVEQIKFDCKALGPHTTWWSEMPTLLDVPKHGVIGMQKVSLNGYSLSHGGYQEVDQQDDFLMMWNDIIRTALALSNWAKQFDIGWDLALEGAVFGSIDKHGNSSDALMTSLGELLLMSDAPNNEQERTSLIAAIQKKYASRW